MPPPSYRNTLTPPFRNTLCMPLRHLLECIWLTVLITISIISAVAAEPIDQESPAGRPQILVLHSQHRGFPFADGLTDGLLAELFKAGLRSSDLYVEYLDLVRHPLVEDRLRNIEQLRHKLTGIPIRLIIAEGEPALEFMADHGKILFTDTPLVACSGAQIDADRFAGRPVVHVPMGANYGMTIRSALNALPDATRILIVAGAGGTDLPHVQALRAMTDSWDRSVTFEYTDHLSHAAMLARVAKAGRETVVLFSSYTGDVDGQAFVPLEVLDEVVQAARTPVFSATDLHLGHGILGGHLIRPRTIGQEIGRLAVGLIQARQVLPEPLTVLELPSRPMFDWQQMRRWHIDPKQLPKGSLVVNRPSTLWQQYKLQVLLTAAVFAIMATLLVIAIRQSHRRKLAEQVAREREQHYRQLIDLAADGIIQGDQHGIVTEVNRQMCALTGMERTEFLGRPVGSLPFMRESSATAPLWTDPPPGETLVRQCRLTRPNGMESVLEMHSKRMPDGSCQAIFRDIGEQLRAHAAQLESERKFSLTFSASPDAITINRCSDYRYTEVNPGFIRLTGYSREEAFGKQPRELGIWHDPADNRRLMERLEQDGQYDNLEIMYRHRNGGVGTVLLSARIVQIDGAPHILTIARDITILKRSEEEILAQKRLFETMFNAIPDAIVITGTDGFIQMTNAAAEALFGYPQPELHGQAVDPLLTEMPWPLPSVPGEPEPPANGEPFVRTYRDRENRVFPGETLLAPMLDRRNNPIGHIGIIRDITRRQRDEADLRQLKVAIEHAGEVVVITDTRGHIQYANPAFERTTGYSVAEAVRQNPRVLQSGQHDREFYRDLWQTISSGRIWKGRFVNRRKDNSLFTEEATISPVFADQGRISHYVAIKRDITEQLRLEAQYLQAQKMESVGRLTGGVAHDFNNILSVIIGYAGMALCKVDPAGDLHEYLGKILDAAERSAGIVKQLLAFSRNQAITPRALDLNELVAGTLNMLHRLLGEEIDLTWIPEAGLPPVLMDPTQVSQILVNLSVNARDAIAGAGTITIETALASFDEASAAEAAAAPGEYVVLTVSDTGCGMPADVLEHIFEPFFTTKGVQGTGLGLATVYGIVKQNNGFINAASEPGRGSVFRITLPMHHLPLEPPAEESPKQLRRGSGETILVVDNDAEILELAEIMLNNLGYRALSAHSPQAALRVLEQHRGAVDLLLADVVMPEKNGRELARLLTQRQADLRVLYMSGHAANAIAHHGVLEADVPFLHKPLTFESLAMKIREVLDHQQRAE